VAVMNTLWYIPPCNAKYLFRLACRIYVRALSTIANVLKCIQQHSTDFNSSESVVLSQ